MTSARRTAEKIIQSMKGHYLSSYTYAQVNEKEFSHLDLQAYKQLRNEFESKGFKYFSDFEILEISNAPNTPLARTIIRSFVSNDGTMVASYYQMCPRLGRLLMILLVGILNFRWIAAPKFFLKNLKTRHCIDFESELENGRFIVTSNTEDASMITNPPTIESKFYPYGTLLNTLLSDHQERLATHIAQNPMSHPIRITSIEDRLQMGRRMQEQKSTYRATVGWITRQELQKMANNLPLQPPQTNTPYNISQTEWDKLSEGDELANTVFQEVQQRLREEKERNKRGVH